jgi:hypothetical protein
MRLYKIENIENVYKIKDFVTAKNKVFCMHAFSISRKSKITKIEIFVLQKSYGFLRDFRCLRNEIPQPQKIGNFLHDLVRPRTFYVRGLSKNNRFLCPEYCIF